MMGTWLIIMSGPVANQFSYPSAGDDGAVYLSLLQDGLPVRNYGIILIQPLLEIFPPLVALSYLYYSLIAVVVVMAWFILRKYGLMTAIVGTPLIILGNWGVWRMWFDGSILALIGMFVFNFGAYLCLNKYHENPSKRWFLLLLAITAGGIIFHKATGLYIIFTSLVFCILHKKALAGVVICLISFMGLYFWRNDNDLLNYTLQNLTPIDFIKVSGFWALLLYSLTFVKYRKWYFGQQTITQILLILMAVLVTGIVINNPAKARLQLELLTVLYIFVAVALAKGLEFIPAKYKLQAVLATILIPVILTGDRWSSDYQPIHKEDMPAIQQINVLAVSQPVRVATTWGESPYIMRLYFHPNVKMTLDLNQADVIITKKQDRKNFAQQGALVNQHMEVNYRTFHEIKTFDNNIVYLVR